MSRIIERLSPKFVRQIDTPGIYNDGAGLSLAVWPRKGGGTTKSWTLRYRRKHLGDRPRVMGLGSVNDFDLGEARERARKARQLIDAGIDPIAARREERAKQAAATARPSVPDVPCRMARMARIEQEWLEVPKDRRPNHAHAGSALRGAQQGPR
jgi:Arm domain-containing DNA-binding protein